jgi:hypothetical protein
LKELGSAQLSVMGGDDGQVQSEVVERGRSKIPWTIYRIRAGHFYLLLIRCRHELIPRQALAAVYVVGSAG